MNYRLFCEAFCDALEIIKKTKSANIKSKKKKLIDSFCDTIKTADVYNQEFHSVCHELETFNYLSQIKQTPIPSDDKKAGADFNSDIGYIECISLTLGDNKAKSDLLEKLKKYQDYISHDVHTLPEMIEPRFTSAVNDKKNKFDKYIKDGVIDKNSKCIICVSPAILRHQTHSKTIEEIFEKILYGIDYLQTMVFSRGNNSTKPEHIETFNNYKDICKKNESVSFRTGYFNLDEYKNISAVILTNRAIAERITKNNFIVFLNHKATNKINEEKLKNIVYFSYDDVVKNRVQFSYKNRKETIIPISE